MDTTWVACTCNVNKFHGLEINKTINHQTNQSINQNIKPINQSIKHQTNQSINQSIKHQTSNQSINQSNIKPINQSINQTSNIKPINQSSNQSINQSINQLSNQSINQSINHQTNHSINHQTNRSTNHSLYAPSGAFNKTSATVFSSEYDLKLPFLLRSTTYALPEALSHLAFETTVP